MKNPRFIYRRREFLRTSGRGILGAGLFGYPIWGQPGEARQPSIGPDWDNRIAFRSETPASETISRLSLVRGEDRREIVFESLRLIEDDVRAAVERKKRILIKPNMSVDKNPLAVTHVDAVRAALDFLRPRCQKPIVVAESGVLNTAAGFRNNGYLALEKEYKVKVVDLNADPVCESWYVAGNDNIPRAVRIYSPFVDPDVCVISLARMKTHDTVLVTLALKNVLMAAPVNDYRKNDKGLLHGPMKSVDDIMHYNLFHLARHGVWPDLAVIDGFESMEGDGPAWGTPIATRLALASNDPLAADIVGTKIMGFDPGRILYLKAMAEAGMGQGDLAKIRVLGAPLDQCRFKFKAHKKMAEIYQLT
ncbi:MAG: DUF362 domain-containing protein [Candidatus Aminicenantes bacterium]|nr:DUF362 domain-containing protein [Candidatus Aminicenantes bacterium]